MKSVNDADVVEQSMIAGVVTGNPKWVRDALRAGADFDIYCMDGFGVTDGKPKTLYDCATFLYERDKAREPDFPTHRGIVQSDLSKVSATTWSGIQQAGMSIPMTLSVAAKIGGA